MTGGTSRVSLAIEGAIARLTLTRGDARNAIDPEWVAALERAISACAEDDGLRAVLITADGPAFTVGGDLDHLGGTLARLSNELGEMIAPYHRTLATLAELPVPVVCAAQGAIAGGGLGLLWAADVVLLADDAKLATGFSKLGLSGDGGSSWYLPRLVGLRRSMQLILHGRVLGAEEALEWHLADRVVPVDELAGEAERAVGTLADGPTLAYGEMRRLIRAALDHELRGGLGAELDAMKRCGATADAREGIAAFARRQTPRFDGR